MGEVYRAHDEQLERSDYFDQRGFSAAPIAEHSDGRGQETLVLDD